MSRLINSRTRSIGGNKFVGFRVGDVRYSVDIQRVREIIRPLTTVALPQLPHSVVGVFHHRGDVVPVIDLRLRFGLVATSHRGIRWVIVKRGRRHVGLVVDGVEEVFGAEAPNQRDVPKLGPGDQARGIRAVYAHAQGLVFEVDLELLTQAAEDLDVGAAGRALSGGGE